MKRFTFILVTFTVFVFLLSYRAQADQAADVQQKISDVNTQIQALDAQIKSLEGQIAITTDQKTTLSNLIKQLNLTRSKLVAERTQTEKKIKATGLVINSLSNDIDAKQKSIDDSRKTIASMIKDLYENDKDILIEKLISQDNLSEVSKEYNSVISVNEQLSFHIEDLSKQEKILSDTKVTKETEQNKLSTLKKSLVQKEAAINATKKEKTNLLAETKNREQDYQKLLEENQKKRDEFEKQLSDYESKLAFILNPDLLPTAGTGVLSWPLDKVFITQLFGKTSSSGRLYASGSHSGVDFRASIGTEVKSMGTGTVIGVGDTDKYCKGASFGKWVFIKYDNGLSSTFGHLSVINAKAGDKVSPGDTVALSGNTGHSTGPHLHVTVYASQGADVKSVPSISCNGHTYIMPIAPTSAYLDPMLYLPKISKKSVKDSAMKD
ncbi:MAG: peptidoglycan DD-metalloendopeptidase family protein [bacterium]